jgi:hypothetical protein
MTVNFTADGNPDPSIFYELTVDSNAIGSRQLFLLFRIPTAPLSEIASVTATLRVDLDDENVDGATLLLVDPNPIQEAKGVVETVSGVPVAVSLGVPLGTENIAAPGTFDFSAGPVPGPDPSPFGDAFSAMEVRANFEISPGDRVTLTGAVTLVPEPAATALLPAVLIAWSLFKRRRTA